MPRKLKDNLYPNYTNIATHSLKRSHFALNIPVFLKIVQSCFGKEKTGLKKIQIRKLITCYNWTEHYKDKKNGRRVLSESEVLEFEHEKATAICMARMGYDVIFAPEGMFKRTDKKFDVFLLTDTIVLKADLKNISSKNPDNIAKRIKEGSDQASRIVVHIASNIEKNILIDALRSAGSKNDLLKEILLIYKSKLYRLPKSLILSKNIYQVFK